MQQLNIGQYPVGHGAPCLVIAEIGINHNGSTEMALELVRKAAEAGANAVKFQARDVPVVYSDDERAKPRKVHRSFIEAALDRSHVEGVTYPVFPEPGQRERLEALLAGTTDEVIEVTTGDQKYSLEFGPKDWDRIAAECRWLGVPWGVSPWDGLSVQMIDGFGVAFHKVASACLTNADLLRRIRRTGKPVIISTGGSTIKQVRAAVEILGRDNLAILQCTATYPSEDSEVDLAVMTQYRRMFSGVPVGYSGHEADDLATRLAAANGAAIVERHITLDPNLPGSDQKASLDPDAFAQMVEGVRLFETRRGTRSVLPEHELASLLTEDQRNRSGSIMGDDVKKVHDREVGTMEKLRRVDDL